MVTIYWGLLPTFVNGIEPRLRGPNLFGPRIVIILVKPIDFSRRDMQRAGRDVEKIVLSRALDLVLNDRVFLYGNKTIIFK